MGVYVGICAEIQSRIQAAMATGRALDSATSNGLKRFLVGDRSQVEGLNEMPSAVLIVKGISDPVDEPRDIARNKWRCSIDFTIVVKYGLSDDLNQNRYFNTTSDTGILYCVENILDVLLSTTTGTLDPRMAQSALRSFRASIGPIEPATNYLTQDIDFTLNSAQFTINQRGGVS